ncbi:hypothetical protein [Aureimonas sp. ME7]|uniref:hypothetical protein n=1 Tax=Aureimonas sp. ME7 TaxID=2744252 RepID=UPI0015F449AB|nr:hypothetical protein [Aureimonas sp. ME7]
MKAFAFLFSDPVRPLEVFSAAALASWAIFLLNVPEALLRDTFSAFDALPAIWWSVLMAAIVLVQIWAMLPDVRASGFLRFVAMALAAGTWTIVALNFWRAATLSTGAGVYSMLALVTTLAGIWLGWVSRNTSAN